MKSRLQVCIALACAALNAPAFAVDYAEERGVVPAAVPPSPDETGKVSNVPQWNAARAPASVGDFFARADANADGALTPGEFQNAAILARSISPRPRG